MTTLLQAEEIRPLMKDLVAALFKNIPSGVGSTGAIRLSKSDETKVAVQGAAWAVKKGFGTPEDLERTEDHGVMEGADPSVLSDRVIKRGKDQLGTLGSGNHFVEVEVVDQIYDSKKAQAYGLFEGQITIFIHSGSRGFGHKVCDEFLKEMSKPTQKASFELPDRQLACAHLKSGQGRRYLAAMACAANYAWANRQVLMHWAKETLLESLSISPRELGMKLLYDVCHNIAKKEQHTVDGTNVMLCVHRKGATRAFRGKGGHDSKFWLQLPRCRPGVEPFQGSKNGKRPGHIPRVGG
jgi:tRNA-splicing ligase RtcB